MQREDVDARFVRLIRRMVQNFAEDKVAREDDNFVNPIPHRYEIARGNFFEIYGFYVYVDVVHVDGFCVEKASERVFVRNWPRRVDIGGHDRIFERLQFHSKYRA